MCRRDDGRCIGTSETWECCLSNCVAWYLDSMSAELFITTGICVAVICMHIKEHTKEPKAFEQVHNHEILRGPFVNCLHQNAIVTLKHSWLLGQQRAPDSTTQNDRWLLEWSQLFQGIFYGNNFDWCILTDASSSWDAEPSSTNTCFNMHGLMSGRQVL